MTEGTDSPDPPAEGEQANAAPAEGSPPDGAQAQPADPADEALAAAAREAEEAVETGAFESGASTQRVRREDVFSQGNLPGPSPLAAIRAAGPTEPSPGPFVETFPATPPVASAERAAPVVETPAAEASPPGEETPALGADPLPPVLPATPEPAPPPAPVVAPAAADTKPPALVRDPAMAETDRVPVAKASGKVTALPRSEEDDRLQAALLFLDAPSPDGQSGTPSPFATVGGVSLLKRAAASCKLAQVPRVVLAARGEPALVERVRGELALGGWDGPIDVWDGHGALPVSEKGRILVLDASGVHDPEAVARLARWKGERAFVLVATEGDGLRVQVEGNRVREVGSQLVPFDGVTCGAVNVPIALWPRLSGNGALSALISLAADGLLGASIESRTFAREIGSETGLSEARQRLLERASGGPHGTFLNQLIARRISRPLTAALLPLGVPPAGPSAASFLLGLAGAGLLAGGYPILQAVGILLIIASTILDCVAYELRSFAIHPQATRSRLEVVPHGIVTAAAVAAWGYGAQLQGDDQGILHGLVAAGGTLIATFLLIIGRAPGEEGRETDATRGIELLARRLLNREIGWVLLLLLVANVASRFRPAVEGPPAHEILDYGVLGLAALTNSFWVGLAFLLALRPPRK